MEGLIPLIYKAIKERRSRRYSRCSSPTSSALGFGAGAVDDVVWDEQKQRGVVRADGQTARKADGGQYSLAEREMTHRRHRSLDELAGEVGAPAPKWRAGGLPRGRSVRIFSCIGGM